MAIVKLTEYATGEEFTVDVDCIKLDSSLNTLITMFSGVPELAVYSHEYWTIRKQVIKGIKQMVHTLVIWERGK